MRSNHTNPKFETGSTLSAWLQAAVARSPRRRELSCKTMRACRANQVIFLLGAPSHFFFIAVVHDTTVALVTFLVWKCWHNRHCILTCFGSSPSAVATTPKMEMPGPPTVCCGGFVLGTWCGGDYTSTMWLECVPDRRVGDGGNDAGSVSATMVDRGRHLEYHHALHSQIETVKLNANWTRPIQIDLTIKLN